MRLRTRSSVDLPQPDGPMKAVTWFVVERQVDVLERTVVAVEEIEVADRDLLGQFAGLARAERRTATLDCGCDTAQITVMTVSSMRDKARAMMLRARARRR